MSKSFTEMRSFSIDFDLCLCLDLTRVSCIYLLYNNFLPRFYIEDILSYNNI